MIYTDSLLLWPMREGLGNVWLHETFFMLCLKSQRPTEERVKS